LIFAQRQRDDSYLEWISSRIQGVGIGYLIVVVAINSNDVVATPWVKILAFISYGGSDT
jgi:hypothetical protein